MRPIAHSIRSNRVNIAHLISVAYAVLVVGISAMALPLLALRHQLGLFDMAVALAAVPALIAAIGLVFYAAFVVIGLLQAAADPQLSPALRRRSTLAGTK